VLVTPAAAGAVLPHYSTETIGHVWINRTNPDAYEHVANAAAGLAERVSANRENIQIQGPSFASARRGVVAAVVATTLFIGAGLLVAAVEQLRDRLRLLAVLAAFGTRRATLAWSVLWQAVQPVALGTIVAASLGTALGAVLLAIAGEPATADWAAIGIGAGRSRGHRAAGHPAGDARPVAADASRRPAHRVARFPWRTVAAAGKR
jgi:hypothetical protein